MNRDEGSGSGYAESIVAALGDGAYVLDADRNRVFVNDRLREVTGFSDEVLHGKHPERIVAEGTGTKRPASASASPRSACSRASPTTSAFS